MRFIEVTEPAGRSQLINPAHIVRVIPSNKGCTIMVGFTSDHYDAGIKVAESYETIKKLIKGGKS